MTCSVPSCDRESKTRGWCQAHYMRWWYTGDVDPDRPLALKARTLLERMDSFIDKAGPCWVWTGSVGTSGYGYVRVGPGTRVAHRAYYEETVGPIPDGLQLDHLCHNADKGCRGGKGCLHRRCVNPAHLEPATQSVNQKRGRIGDAIRERSAALTHCPHGHEKTPENTYVFANGAKVCKACAKERGRRRTHKAQGLPDPRRTSAETVAEVRRLLATGLPQEEVARRVGISGATVSRINTGGSWFSSG